MNTIATNEEQEEQEEQKNMSEGERFIRIQELRFEIEVCKVTLENLEEELEYLESAYTDIKALIRKEEEEEKKAQT